MLSRSMVVGIFDSQLDESTVNKTLLLFCKYLKSLGFRKKYDYLFQEGNICIKIKPLKEENIKNSLIVIVSIKDFDLRREYHLYLVDFSELKIFENTLMFIPEINWINRTKITQKDLLFPDEISRLLSEDLLIGISIILSDYCDYETINILILFSALTMSFYLSLVSTLKEAYDRISQSLRSFTAIVTHDKYVTLKELTQKFDRWLENLNKLSNFLDSNFYRITGKFIDSNCFRTISRDLSNVIRRYYARSKKELIIPIEDVDKLYTGRISEKSAIAGGIIGAIIGVILTCILRS